MSQNDPEVLSREEIKEVFEEVVHDMFKQMGIDAENPMEMQRDFQHLRDWRESSNTIRRHGIVTAVGIFTTGILALLWLGIQNMMGQ